MTEPSGLQFIKIEEIHESPHNPRKTFQRIEELAEDLKRRGMLQPILVRPRDGSYELVFGARRYRAAKLAGMETVPTFIKEMDDQTAIETQLIENAKRDDIHPLEEAEAYKMLREKYGYDIDSIAVKMGKSVSAVYQRLKLSELIPEAKEKFLSEKITAGHAILIARLQPDQQKELAKKESGLYEGWGPDRTVVSVRELADYIERQIHLDLNSASFKKSDPDLVPEAGPCTTCRKRTGFQPELFPDIKKKDTCTDPSCFHKKVEVFTKQWIEKKSQNSDVPPLRLSTSYDGRVKKLPDDPEKPIPSQLYHEIKDKKKDICSSAREGIITDGGKEGRALLVCVDPRCEKHHRSYSSSSGDNEWRAKQKAEDEKKRLAFKIREAILDATLEAWPGKFTREDLLVLAAEVYRPIWHEDQRKILKRKGLTPKKEQYSQNTQVPMATWLNDQKEKELQRFLLECVLFRNLDRHRTDKRKADPLIETAKRYGVDPKKIEVGFRAEVKEKRAEKKGKKKKVPRVRQDKKRTILDPGGTTPDELPPCESCAKDVNTGRGRCFRTLFTVDDAGHYVCKSKKPVSKKVKKRGKKADPPKAKTISMKDLCKLHAPRKKKGESKPGVCRECGCTETTPCEGGCAWMDKTKTLCTACQMAKEHRWEKQNITTIALKGGVPMHDIYKCKKCGATGKRFGLSEYIRRDKRFADQEQCPGPKKEVQTSAKKKDHA